MGEAAGLRQPPEQQKLERYARECPRVVNDRYRRDLFVPYRHHQLHYIIVSRSLTSCKPFLIVPTLIYSTWWERVMTHDAESAAGQRMRCSFEMKGKGGVITIIDTDRIHIRISYYPYHMYYYPKIAISYSTHHNTTREFSRYNTSTSPYPIAYTYHSKPSN